MAEPDESDFEQRYRASLERERVRGEAENGVEGRLAAIYAGSGAIGFGLVGLLIGPVGNDSSLGERLATAGLAALGGALLGLRLSSLGDRDD